MAETLSSGIVKVSTSASMTTTPDVGNSTYSFNESKTISYTNGTSANQANMVWTDTRTINASSSENLDLSGVLVSALQTTIAFTKIKAISIEAASANTNNVLVGGDSAGLASIFVLTGDAAIEDVQLVVRPGGVLCLATGDATAYAVTNSSADILKIANSSSGSSVTYTIKIFGVV